MTSTKFTARDADLLSKMSQTGSHIRLTTQRNGEHHVTVPDHEPLRVGTLAGILAAVAQHHGMSRDDLLRLLFSKH